MADNPEFPLSGSGDATARPRTSDQGGDVHIQHMHPRGPRAAGTADPASNGLLNGVSEELLPANDDRTGLMVTSLASVPLYLRFGESDATTTAFSEIVAPAQTVRYFGAECPRSAVQALLDGGNGTVVYQEFEA